MQPFLRPPEALLGVERLRDEDARTGAPDVVLEHGAPIHRPFVVVGQLEPIAQGHRRDPVERRDRALGGRIETAQRLDAVARELHPHGVGVAGREEVYDASAAAELPVRLDRIGVTEPGVGEPIGQIPRRQRAGHLQFDHRLEQALRRAQTREDPRRRRHHHARPADGESREGAGAGGQDAHVRGDAAVWVDLAGGKRQDAPVEVGIAEPFQGPQMELRVGRHRVDVGVPRHDQHDRARAGEHGRGQRLRGGRHARQRLAASGRTAGEPGAVRRVVQQGAQRQRSGYRRHVGQERPPAGAGGGPKRAFGLKVHWWRGR